MDTEKLTILLQATFNNESLLLGIENDHYCIVKCTEVHPDYKTVFSSDSQLKEVIGKYHYEIESYSKYDVFFDINYTADTIKHFMD